MPLGRIGLIALGLALLACASAVLSEAQESREKRPLDHTLPAVSADGRWVYFIGDGPNLDQLWVVSAGGGDERRLTHAGAHLPRWIGSPGVITYAGVGTSPDSGRVFAISTDGSKRETIATVAGRSPVLSPDGTRVAYLAGPWREAEIWVVGVGEDSLARRVAGGEGRFAWNPAWSPDGTRLAYTYGDSTRRPQVHIVKVVSSVRDTAITDTLDAHMAFQMPAWSPDGKKLAVQWNKDQGQGIGIAVIDLVTHGLRLLEPPATERRDPIRDETPTWHPDNRHLVFRSNRSGNVDLWEIAEDGTGLKQLTGLVRR